MKIKLISLAVASSLALSACNSGASDANNQGIIPSNTAVINTVATKTTDTTIFKSLCSSVLEGFSSSFILSPAGIGSALGSLVTNLIFGEQEDQTTNTLVEINGKLDDILTGLSNQLSLSQDDSNVINAFYKTYVGDQLAQSLSTFSDDNKVITSKYDLYLTQNAFGENETPSSATTEDKVTNMYNVAASKCNDTDLLEALDAEITTSSNQLKSTSAKDPVYSIFTEFKTFYGAESTTYTGSGSAYKILQASKANYISALKTASITTDANLLQYINKYNYENINYAVKLSKSLQDLYNMQFAQLAYKYACGAKIKLSNINLPDNVSGLGGYKQAVEKLNETYEPVAKNLSNNLVAFMSPLSNKELVELVNNDWFKSGTPFLSSQFESSGAEPGNCYLSNLTLNKLATNSTHSYGVIDVDAQCVTKKANPGFESASISLEVPYASEDGYNVDRYGVSNIGFDLQMMDMSYIVESNMLSSDDIYQITKNKDFCNGYFHQCHKEMNLVSSSMVQPDNTNMGKAGSAILYEYDPLIITGESGVRLYTNVYSHNYDLYEKDIMPNEVSVSSNKFYRDKYVQITNMVYNSSSYTQDWGLAIYHGKAVAVKIQTVHSGGNKVDQLHKLDLYLNYITKQAGGIGCLSSNHGCTRNDYNENDFLTALTWNDGTEVKLETTLVPGERKLTPEYMYLTTPGGGLSRTYSTDYLNASIGGKVNH